MRDVCCFRLEREKAILVNEVALVHKERDDQLLRMRSKRHFMCQPMRKARNFVPRVLSYPHYGAGERETLENAGHVAPEQK